MQITILTTSGINAPKMPHTETIQNKLALKTDDMAQFFTIIEIMAKSDNSGVV